MPQTPRSAWLGFSRVALGIALAGFIGTMPIAWGTEGEVLRQQFVESVQPFLRTHCIGCHGQEEPEAKLDLTIYSSTDHVARAHQTWESVLERLEANEMPPQDAKTQPSPAQRMAVIEWIRALRKYEAERNAGDPGPVLVRRLSNAEYNYTIRDLTQVDIRPTATFPVDPANEAGFDNSGESLAMSPALLNKYLDAARLVAEHLLLTPTGVAFAPHPVVTDTDRDKYGVKRIIEFYQAQPTDLAAYFHVCWKYQQLEQPTVDVPPQSSLEKLAIAARLSPKYTQHVWTLLNDPDAAGPVAKLQEMFRAVPQQADESQMRTACEAMRDYVRQLRAKLAPTFPNLYIEGNHKGSQPFVLWKNRQYAAHRRTFDREALFVEGQEVPEGTPAELILPNDESQQTRYLASLERFCATFPDDFYISERGRDYLDIPREKQEKGRLLSAGFHSMMGYFRDDGPLVDLVLDESQQQALDRLWAELNYISSTATRQYSGFLWFERTDSRYMREAEFDFARAEDKSAASADMIQRLAEVYLDKARRNGGSEVAVQAIEDYFTGINQQVRWLDEQRASAEPIHRAWLPRFASRAWRRSLWPEEAQEILAFYRSLRDDDRLEHEEAIRDCVVSILMSPHFLYRMDLASAGEGTRPLTDVEVASRLSYFLWSSLPDDTLMNLVPAPNTKAPLPALQDSESIVQQARRMLDDVRIRGLATEFAGNWLDFRRFEEHNSVDRERFPEFTDELRQAMFEEPVRFFVDLVRHDRSVLELLDGDHTFVNPVLAKHYGIEGLDFHEGSWVRVEDARRFNRGGLLPMSVFLTQNAPGLRTSPVKRGYWVVRRLLGERIPPPPPNVPELPASENDLGDRSLREILAQHRDNASCAGCHDRFDAIGLVFEGYGPVGELRDVDLGGRPVEITARFPNGEEGSGVAGLREYLRAQRQQEFVDNLCRKLLSYALSRTLLLSDEPLIVKMKSQLAADDFRFSSLIESIVTSRQFLEKRGRDQLVKEH